MSALSDKILSYNPEVYVKLDETYRTNPTNLGSLPTSTWTLSNEPPIYQAAGGPDGEGGWDFNVGRGIHDTTPTRFRISSGSNAYNTLFTDGYFSVGFWFKTDFTLNDAEAQRTLTTIAQFGTMSTVTPVAVNIYGGSANFQNKGKLYISSSGGGGLRYASRVDDQQWHYVALVVEYELEPRCWFYLDGQLVTAVGSPDYITLGSGTSLLYTTQLGNNSVTTSPASNDWSYVQFSSFYHTEPSVINATEIAEIWAAGTGAGPTNNLTYWDGTQWAVPTNKYQWDGTNWVTFNGKYWNGSAWIDIT